MPADSRSTNVPRSASRTADQPTRTWLCRSAPEGGTMASGAQRALWIARVCVIAMTLALLALLGRVAQLQTHPDERVLRLLSAHSSNHTVMARRGALLDRRGRLLAATRVGHRLFVDPHLIEDHGSFPEHVAYNLDYDPVAITKQLFAAGQRRYVVLDQRLSDERLDTVRDMELRGLATEPMLVRDYPYGHLAGQVLGFVGRDGAGLEGLEAMFDDQLKPTPGRISYLRDARRRAMRIREHDLEPHTDGQPVRLAIDAAIQSHVEHALAQTVEQFNAKHGQMIVMDPHTGEVLAMANHPAFDPNAFQRSNPEHWRNRTVTDVFEPGSIFKPFVWAMATQLGLAEPEERIDVTEAGVWRSPRGRRLRDVRGHGTITWDDVLVRSSNIGMAQVGMRFGIDKLHQAISAFGFGAPTNSRLPGEVGGILRPASQWNHYSETSLPMGQEIGVTALQIMRAFGAFANDGLLVTPTLLAVDRREFTPIQERILRPGVAAHTRQVMGRVVSEGTGRHARSERYVIFGKTGTAQLADLEQGGYKPDSYIASFIAGAPLDAPRLVVGCFIHEPDPEIGYYGGLVAGPPVKQVLEQSLQYLGVPPRAPSQSSMVDRH